MYNKHNWIQLHEFEGNGLSKAACCEATRRSKDGGAASEMKSELGDSKLIALNFFFFFFKWNKGY